MVCGDLDGDGDVDVFQAHRGPDNAATLWRNVTVGTRAVRVRLRGAAPNTQAAGARIRATIGDAVQLREISIGSNYTSQNPAEQVFGLGAATQVDALEVEWPDGRRTTVRDVAAGRRVEIDHPLR